MAKELAASERSGQWAGAEQKSIAISELRYNPENPRIRYLLGPREPTQENIHQILLSNGMDARELVPSFLANGFLPYEPLVVKPAKRGKHLVLEGNRRLAALRSMRDSDDPRERQAFAEKRLDTVPCLVFRGTAHEEIAYLGLRHLSKTKDWSSSAKAEFVERVLRSGLGLTQAARLTNTSASALRLLLLTRRLFERAGQLGIDLPVYTAEGEVMFWHLGDALRRTNTKGYLRIRETENPLEQPVLDEERFENLVGWIYGNPKIRQAKLISSIRDIPKLDKCLGHPRSIDALQNGQNIEEALEEAQAAGYTVSSHLARARKSVQRATSSVSDVDGSGVQEVRESRRTLGRAIQAFDRAFERTEG